MFRAREPCGLAPPEGDQEGLAEQVVGELADAAAQVAVHGGRVPVEQRRELRRVVDRGDVLLRRGGLLGSGNGWGGDGQQRGGDSPGREPAQVDDHIGAC